ncbi:MAG: hypothetical protein WBO43_02770 [Gemmatimonadota bacterium]
MAFKKRTPDSDGSPLVIARVSDGEIRTVTEAPASLSMFSISGPGGPATQGNEILYLETNGETSELRAASFDGGSRILRTLPIVERRAMGVFGDRVVWAESAGDSTDVMIADGPDGKARRLASVAASFEGLVWPPDGHWIAGSAYFGDGEGDHLFKIVLIGVDEAGNVTSPPRQLDTEIGVGWGIRWLPDSQGLTIFAQSLPSFRTDVWLFSMREGESPVALTSDETTEFWYYSLSPDGRYIAYPAAVPRGSSIWMVELSTAQPLSSSAPTKTSIRWLREAMGRFPVGAASVHKTPCLYRQDACHPNSRNDRRSPTTRADRGSFVPNFTNEDRNTVCCSDTTISEHSNTRFCFAGFFGVRLAV